MEASKKITALSVTIGILVLAVAGVVYYYEVYKKKQEIAVVEEDTKA